MDNGATARLLRSYGQCPPGLDHHRRANPRHRVHRTRGGTDASETRDNTYSYSDQQTLPHARDTPPERRAWSQSHGCSANLLKRHAVEGPRLPPAPLTRAGTGAKDSGGDAAHGLDPLRNCAGRGAGHCQAGSDQRYAASCCEADGNDGLTARSGGEPLRLITCVSTHKC